MTEQNSITCASCGGDVSVTTQAARVASCPYCETTMIVNEEAIRALGKMALLAETPSCLAVGWRAKCLGREIHVLGRIQYRYHSGIWDEWWVQFVDDDSYAWISQDEDEYTLERPLPNMKAPDYDAVSPGDRFKIGGRVVWIEEKDRAAMAGMQGELPLDAAPEATMRYIDLTDNRLKLTVEYFDDGTHMGFQGRYLKRKDLQALDQEDHGEGLGQSPYSAPALAAPPAPAPPVRIGKSAAKTDEPSVIRTSTGVRPQSITCLACGGTVELRDMKGTAMLACQFCDAVMDVTVPGAAQLLYRSERQKLPFPIPIGAQGRINGVDWTVIGRVRYREDDPSGIWTWDELQLHSPERGYIFLALEEGHWMLFERLEHRVEFDPRYSRPKQKFSLHGQTFRVFERSRATIDYVEGELSWVARLGDELGFMDAIRPPQMVSAEWTENEIEWTIGRYVPREEVAAAFKVDAGKLPRPQGVAPAQPFKRTRDQAVRAWAGLAAGLLLMLMCLVTFATGGGEKVFSTGPVSPAEYLSDNGFVSQPFDVPEGSHVCALRARGTGLNNSWVGLTVAILNEEEKVVLDADSVVEYYSGVEGGESWSEGSRTDSTLVRLTGPEKYRLNVFGEAGVWSRTGGDRKTTTGSPVTFEVRRGVVPARFFFIAAIVALAYPLWEFGRGILFEGRRWPSDDD